MTSVSDDAALDTVRGGEGKKETLPRYVRINSLQIDANAAHRKLKESGYSFIKPVRMRGGRERWRKPKQDAKVDRRSYQLDPHIPNLLVFPPHSNMGKHPMVLSGELIIQDKASCFTAQALSPPPGSVVMDACAAPGSKTTHLAALMQGRGTVFAFDRDPTRLEKLKFVLNRTGASAIVRPVLLNYLKAPLNAKAFANVTHVLVDPSCSGSGMNLTWSLRPPKSDEKELEELAENQLKCILHAMSCKRACTVAVWLVSSQRALRRLSGFQCAVPKVRAVAYSTCSVFDEENERVVERALAANSRFELARALPDWPTRGKPLFPNGTVALSCVQTACCSHFLVI